MKKALTALLGILLPLGVGAQGVVASGRATEGVDYKIVKGLHISVEEEIRAGDNFSALGSLRTTVGLSYKPFKYIKAGVGYTLINPWGTAEARFKEARHRGYAEVTGYLPLGDFQLSLKEKVQLTHRGGDFNRYQSTPNAVALKSRLGVKYKAWRYFEPGLAFELRTALNDPWGHTVGAPQYNGEGREYLEYSHSGYTHVYNDRYRLDLSGEIKFDKHHSLKPYLLADFCSDYEIDTNREGTRLFSAGYHDFTRFTIGLEYVFSF